MRYLICALALSFGVAQAAAPPANMTNQTFDGQNIKGGTYFGTTTFINSAGTGINLDKGQNIRGSMGLGKTVDGGNIIIHAPTQVVKLDGNIDVRGGGSTFNGGTVATMNGGNVTIDAAYLFQNGNIYTSGFNGGNVTMNVGGMTMGSSSLIDAHSTSTGATQPGGFVSINSTGQVDILKGAKINTTGTTFWVDNRTGSTMYGNYGSIAIQGTAVNMDGVLQANQAVYTHKPSGGGMGEVGGVIRLVSTNGDVNIGSNAIIQADSANGASNPRTIAISSSNDINQNGLILANGSRGGSIDTKVSGEGLPVLIAIPGAGGSGGKITLTAAHDINQNGRMVTDGGNGDAGFPAGNAGTMVFTANNAIVNNGVIRAMGGDTDPTAAANYPLRPNNGGNGGKVTFSGANPTGTGAVVTFGGIGAQNGALGTITAPDPAASTNTLIGVWQKTP